MQRTQQVFLPGESRPGIFPRRPNRGGSARGPNTRAPQDSQIALNGSRSDGDMLANTGAIRQPLDSSTAPRAVFSRQNGYNHAHPENTSHVSQFQPLPAHASAVETITTPGRDVSRPSNITPATSTPVERGERATTSALEHEYRAGHSNVNLDDYFMGVIGQFKDDSAVMNPMNITIHSDSASSTVVATNDTEALLQQLAEKIANRASVVDLSNPIGHSAIDDTRVFFDTLIMSQAYSGYASGEIPMQFVDLNGTRPPDRIVKITVTPFNFPHIYTANTTTFDMFYFRSVFMTVRFVPTMHLIQSSQPNELFTFELYVDDIDSGAVYLRPLEPTFCLKQPVTVTGDLTVRFQTRNPNGTGFIGCPIPPTRVLVTRTASGAGPPVFTTFTMQGGIYIGALAPPGATYTVPIIFQNYNTPPSLLEAAIVNQVGWASSTFVAPSSFNIPIDTSAIVLGSNETYIFIPKNGVSFTIRFSSLQSTKTNDLLPIHT